MRFTLILLLSLFTYTTQAQQTINATITHDGLQRNYILYIPATYNSNAPAPLVFNFHGFTSSATAQRAVANFEPIADTAGFILVHPQGTTYLGLAHWNVGGWVSGSTADDVGFVSAMIDTISAQYNINPKRIYCTGYSNGGFFSLMLACRLSNKIAAVASNSGTMTTDMTANCTPAHPTPVLQIHGDNDLIVPYAGNGTWGESVDKVLKYWVGYNQCDTTPVTTAIPDINTNDGSTAQYMVYEKGLNQVTVEHIKVTGGGHEWPGATGNMDFNASLEMWRFFSKYDITGPVNINTNTKDVIIEPVVYPNPSNERTTLSFTAADAGCANISIYNMLGKVVQQKNVNYRNGRNRIELNTTAYNAGVYFIHLQPERSQSKSVKLLVK